MFQSNRDIGGKKGIYRLDLWIIVITSILGLSLLTMLIHFGSPLTDESFPFATAYRFLIGQRPFVDDFSAIIPLGLLLTPLVKLSLIIHHGRDSLILFTRELYIVFSFFLALYTFFVTQKIFPTIVAFFIAINILIFHPFGINNFHYDTLTTLFWTIIVFQAFVFVVDDSMHFLHYLVFALLNLLLCCAYPPFLFFLVLFNGYILVFMKKKGRLFFTLLTLFFCASIVLIWILFGFFKLTSLNIKDEISFLHNLSHNSHIAYYSPYNDSLIAKLFTIIKEIKAIYFKYLTVSFLLICLAYFLRKFNLVALMLIVVSLILPLFYISYLHPDYHETFYFLNSVAFSAAYVFLFFLRSNELAKKLFYFIWVPSLLAGYLTSATSSNFAVNLNIGFFPATLLAFVFAYLVGQKSAETRMNYLITRGLLIFGIGAILFFQLYCVYGLKQVGIAIYKNNEKVTRSGPFRGLYLDPDIAQFIDRLQSDIERLDTDNKKYIYFGVLSGGYLLVNNLRPGEYVLYCYFSNNHQGMKVRLPNYVVNSLPAFPIEGWDIHKTYLTGAKYHKILENKGYEIYEGR